MLAIAQRFIGYRDTWLQRGVGFMLRQWMPDDHVSARLLARPDGERRLTNLLHLIECLHEAAQAHPAPDTLLHWFQSQRVSHAGSTMRRNCASNPTRTWSRSSPSTSRRDWNTRWCSARSCGVPRAAGAPMGSTASPTTTTMAGYGDRLRARLSRRGAQEGHQQPPAPRRGRRIAATDLRRLDARDPSLRDRRGLLPGADGQVGARDRQHAQHAELARGRRRDVAHRRVRTQVQRRHDSRRVGRAGGPFRRYHRAGRPYRWRRADPPAVPLRRRPACRTTRGARTATRTIAARRMADRQLQSRSRYGARHDRSAAVDHDAREPAMSSPVSPRIAVRPTFRTTTS